MENINKAKLKLPNVTLAALTSVRVYETIQALEYSMRGIEFGDVVLITHRKPFRLPDTIKYKHTSKLKNIDYFNYKTAYELGNYIDTDYVLLVHYDGFVVHPESWRDEFLQYDYVGSPWPMPEGDQGLSYYDIYGNICRVGNSVSLRSKELLDFPRKENLKWEKDAEGWYNEDTFLCCRNKHKIEEAGMKIAPIEVAKYFGHECMIPEIAEIDNPFVFHKWRGKNAQYPVFHDPWTDFLKKVKSPWAWIWKKFKRIVKKVLICLYSNDRWTSNDNC